MTRKNINRGSKLETEIGFSRAVRIKDTIAVSGTAPIASDGATSNAGDVYAQTMDCLRLSQEAIEELGGSIGDTIRTRIMLTDIENWQEAARAHGVFFADVQPACTFVEVKGFIRPDWLVETEVDAVCSSEATDTVRNDN
tara:strand:+ start:664 stop:1083 length:420 start_codon:yes stop_codon:yes gene_type:complete